MAGFGITRVDNCSYAARSFGTSVSVYLNEKKRI